MQTDTIIVTSRDSTQCNVTDEEVVGLLQRWLSDTILLSHKIVAQDPVELLILRNFKRILIISPSREVSMDIMSLFSEQEQLLIRNLQYLQFNYSMTDSHQNGNNYNQITKDYLKLPPSDKLFLISPPGSPPAEFDYSKCEDMPRINEVHQKLRPSDSITTRDKNGNSVQKYTLLTSNVANITIEKCNTTGSDGDDEGQYGDNIVSIDQFRTAVPPRSIFESDDECED